MKKIQFVSIITFLIYAFVNILSINTFPFVHSDETWLAGLSRTITEAGTFKITEPFFTLYPRQPHAIKSLFHTVQGIWISIWGYNITSVRSLSLLVALSTLACTYIYLSKKNADDTSSPRLIQYQIFKPAILDALPLVSTFVMALSVQFVYASHFGRQEAFLLLFLSLSYIVVDMKIVNQPLSVSTKWSFVAAIITGIAIGFHPNSFLIACVLGSMLLYDALLNRRLHPIFVYTITTGVIASIYIYISIVWNASFIRDYNNFGDSLGATVDFLGKLQTFPLFIYKLFNQISATYFTPNIRIEVFVFILLFIISTFLVLYRFLSKSVHTPRLALPLMGCIGLTIGLIFIGRYNATSIVFYLPFMTYMTFGILSTSTEHLDVRPFYILIILFLGVSGLLGYNTVKIVFEPNLESYDLYIQEIENTLDSHQFGLNQSNLNQLNLKSSFYNNSIKPRPKTLVNLNAGFAFNPNGFLDYRDLGRLKDNNISIKEYLEKNNIQFVVLSEEMDYIYRNQQRWSILYGDMSYYPEFLSILKAEFTLIHSFESPQYGMRIPQYNDGYPWLVRIYEKNQSSLK